MDVVLIGIDVVTLVVIDVTLAVDWTVVTLVVIGTCNVCDVTMGE